MFFTHDSKMSAAKVGVDAKKKFFAADAIAELHWR